MLRCGRILAISSSRPAFGAIQPRSTDGTNDTALLIVSRRSNFSQFTSLRVKSGEWPRFNATRTSPLAIFAVPTFHDTIIMTSRPSSPLQKIMFGYFFCFKAT